MTANKVVVVGLDGATFDLIEPWVEQGRLPTFKKLMRDGAWGRLKSTVPPITPCAWSSFMTGKNPGKHGQFSFYKLNESFGLDVAWREYRTEETVWQILSREGKRCCVINVPFTYPPHEMNGYMVSGFTTPSLRSNFTYPRELKKELLRAIPEFRISEDSRYSQRREDKRRFAQDIAELTDIHEKVARYLMEKEDWDFYMITFMAIDHIQHWYWKYMDESHPAHEPDEEFKDKILEIYVQIDSVLERLMQRLSQDTNLVLISDHGSGMYLKDVNVNQWLKEKGYLKMKRTPSTALKGLLRSLGVTPQSVIGLALKMGIGRVAKPSPSVAGGLPKRVLDSIGYTWKDIDWRRTKAYSFGYYGEIFINLKGRETQGSVEPAEYDELREEIIAQLKTMKVSDSGERLVDHVWKKEELYWGNKTDMAPDINLCMRDYSYAAATMLAFPSGRIFSPPKTLKSGEHRGHGILLAYGAGVTKGCRIDNAEIVDLAPTILELMGVDIPSDMDGKVLREVLQD